MLSRLIFHILIALSWLLLTVSPVYAQDGSDDGGLPIPYIVAGTVIVLAILSRFLPRLGGGGQDDDDEDERAPVNRRSRRRDLRAAYEEELNYRMEKDNFREDDDYDFEEDEFDN